MLGCMVWLLSFFLNKKKGLFCDYTIFPVEIFSHPQNLVRPLIWPVIITPE